MKHTSLILYILLLSTDTFSQQRGLIYSNQNERLFFIDDTHIEFCLIGGYQGSIVINYHGYGKYKIENDSLIILVMDHLPDSVLSSGMQIICKDSKERNSGVDKYIIEYSSSDTLELIGPIVNDYRELNRKRFLRGFVNWPWKWSFKKQHWYDPRQRLLSI